LGEVLLEPTRIYVRSLLPLVQEGRIKGLAHITGGGLLENIPRVLPDDLAAEIDASRWTLPPVFAWLGREARLDRDEMARTFNCGIGMVAVVAPEAVERVATELASHGETVFRIGAIVPRGGGPGTVIRNRDGWPG
jgi:phosphoribosylformylglycinamidine cyclo-ligase